MRTQTQFETDRAWIATRGTAIAVAAFSALMLGLGACSRTAGSPNAADSGSAAGASANTEDPSTRAARLSSANGDVALQTAGAETWSQATPNYTITSGDRLHTAAKSRAELDLGNAAMRLGEGADVTVTNLTDHFSQFGVDQGAFDASLYGYDPGDSIEIDTPNGALMPLSAGNYLVSVDPNGDATLVTVESGSLSLTGPGLERTLNAGQIVRLFGTNPIQVEVINQPEPVFSDLDQWRTERDARWHRSGLASRNVSQSIPGWEDLDDAGQWTTDATSTEVWCPTRVPATWVPYRDGHWSWVEPWGWTWVDDQPWGYATSHYGRWEQLNSAPMCGDRWAWVPGPVVAQPVYAPALVAFVDVAALGPSVAPSPQAWFPLGPQEPYFPSYHYSDRYLREVNATNLREVRDVDPIIRVRDVDNVRWVNREAALTAVPATVFRSGEPVNRETIRVRPEQFASVRIAPHPSVNPDPRLLEGGRPALHPPVDARRPEMVVTRNAPVPTRPTRVARTEAPMPRTEAPNAAPERRRMPQAPASGEVVRPMLPPERRPMPAPPRAPAPPRPIITRNPPPPHRPPPAPANGKRGRGPP